MKFALELLAILVAASLGVYFAATIRSWLKAKRTAAANALKAAAEKAEKKL